MNRYQPPKRHRFTAAERREVYAKTDGYCAYCGCELPASKMQVDHVLPVDLGGTDDMANLLPACRSCNNYKSTLTLEKFRQAVRHWPTVLMRDSVTFRNAVRFGMVKPTPHSVTFYFETLGIHVEEYGAACAGEGGSQ